MLIVLSGLPGTGKTTIARTLAAKIAAAYLRIDAIEHALNQQIATGHQRDTAGYAVAYALATSNLRIGNHVVADCVNPVAQSRQGWRNVARGVDGATLINVEIICSDLNEHRRRVEGREADIPGFALPTWASIASLAYQPWTETRLVIDTADLSADEAVAKIKGHIADMADRQTLWSCSD